MPSIDSEKYQSVRTQILRTLIEILPTLKAFTSSKEGRLAAQHVEADLVKLEQAKEGEAVR